LKTTVNDELTRDYFQKLERQNYLATTSVVVLVTISFFWSLFHIGGDKGVNLFTNIMYPLSSAIGAFWACTTAYRIRFGPVRLALHHQLAWLLIGLGLIANCFGGIWYTYLAQTGMMNPIPSAGDLGFTLFYPLTFAGLLIMPKALQFRKRIALDSMITTLCILGVSWYFFISTIYVANRDAHEAFYTFIVTVSYPFWDMLLILAIVLLIQQRTEPILRASLAIFAVGILCQIWADTGYAYTLAINIYSTGTVYIDPFWFIGFLLFGLSALYQYSALTRRAFNEQTSSLGARYYRSTLLSRARRESVVARSHFKAIGPRYPFNALSAVGARFIGPKPQRRQILTQSMLIYLPLAVLLILMLFSEYTDGGKTTERSFFLVVLTAIVGILVAVRCLLTTRENEILLQEREQSRREADCLRLLCIELTNIFVLDQLLDRITLIVTSELGFEAAMLVLIEDDGPLNAESRLLVRAATSHALEAVTWRLQGTRLPNCTILLGHEREVTWSQESLELPAEVAKWHQEQAIQATLFMPLIYREKILGSLGFASHSSRHFTAHQRTLAKAYTEMVVAVIEHTRLYQTISEQESFAKAVANIATRLNAASVEPAEIHQLICTEAANALRADYALLYGHGVHGELVPLATFVNETEPQTALYDWPPIFPYEYEYTSLSELQPVLMQVHTQITPNTAANNHLLALPAPRSRDQSGPYAAISPPRVPARGTPTMGGGVPLASTPGYLTSSLREELARRNVQTAILAPLIAGGDALGLLILARALPPGTHEKKSFTIAQLPQVQDFAEQAGVAFTNAQMYQRERIAYQRLQEVDQLKDQFMITASHELRTPLTAVQGYIELMAQYDELLLTEQRREFLQKARRSCDELVVLLGNVMDASRLEIEAGIRPAHMDRVVVQDMIDSVIDLIEPQLTQEHREAHLDIPSQVAVRADGARLRQILMNISVNALKYSPPFTPLVFSACVVEHDRSVVISIADKGKGILPQDQGRLFKRFVRLESDINSPVRGSGLGLYISHRLIEAMNGKIWIESTGIPGKGSIFHIQLPMA
jgi:signal transduction histidine kinase